MDTIDINDDNLQVFYSIVSKNVIRFITNSQY
jgi:hypothetical protein